MWQAESRLFHSLLYKDVTDWPLVLLARLTDLLLLLLLVGHWIVCRRLIPPYPPLHLSKDPSSTVRKSVALTLFGFFHRSITVRTWPLLGLCTSTSAVSEIWDPPHLILISGNQQHCQVYSDFILFHSSFNAIKDLICKVWLALLWCVKIVQDIQWWCGWGAAGRFAGRHSYLVQQNLGREECKFGAKEEETLRNELWFLIPSVTVLSLLHFFLH